MSVGHAWQGLTHGHSQSIPTVEATTYEVKVPLGSTVMFWRAVWNVVSLIVTL